MRRCTRPSPRQFSLPPSRDGHKAVLPTLFPNLPSSAYEGEGDNIVVLVDNVRDANFYDPDNAERLLVHRGLLLVAASTTSSTATYDHRRVRLAPPHRREPAARAGDRLCTSAPARPFLYEGVFAHEYQHLLSTTRTRTR